MEVHFIFSLLLSFRFLFIWFFASLIIFLQYIIYSSLTAATGGLTSRKLKVVTGAVLGHRLQYSKAFTLFQNNFIADECNTLLFLCFDTSSPLRFDTCCFFTTLCCFFTSTLRCFFTTLLLRFDTALLLHHVGFDTVSSLSTCFDTALLLRFDTALLLRFDTALLLRFDTASLLRFNTASLLHFNTVLLLRLATLICLQLLGSLIRLSRVYSPYLRVCISVGKAHWATTSRALPLQYTGEFSYIPKYWEWLEDILSRNKKILTDAKIYGAVYASLFTYDRNVHAMQSFLSIGVRPLHFVGEISITLWDLCFIGGLPLYGSFYDEVVPSTKEMHHPSLRVVSKTSQQTVFEEIREGKVIPQSARDHHDSSPGIFKVASSMARGKKYCLAVPVLATIYKGLNDIASFSVPSKCDTTFPAHYLNAWLAEYFATHFDLPEASPFDSCMVRFSEKGAAKYFEEAEARKLFRSITKFKFHCSALFKRHQEILEDNDQLSDSYVNYFISQRPSYLSSRRGDLSVLEPYSPHRFGCQFGFTQDIPGEIKEDLCTAPLERVISRSDSDRHWRCRKYKDNVVDDVNHEIVMKMTEAFIDVDIASPFSGGDEQVSLSSFFDSANMEFVRALCCLFNDHMVVSVIQELVEDENLDISLLQVGVDSLKETFDLATKVIDKLYLEKSNAFIPPLGPIYNLTKDMVSKVRSLGVPTTSIVLILNAEDVISKASRHYAFMLGEGLIEKIIKTPFDSVASLKEEFMENASQYSSIRSALTQRISLEVKNQRCADAERLHTLALKSEAIEARDSSIAEAELSKVLSRETELRKELELLVTQRGKLENSISLHEEKLPQL
uniref:Aminotransferase-like plant mobile domain-containing protein n=1 Tax=Fagus sylvatica TaxID=28930 RepID=A0A2N9F7B1_FAGSY